MPAPSLTLNILSTYDAIGHLSKESDMFYRLIVLTCITMLWLPSMGQAATSSQFKLDFSVSRNNQLISEPSIAVEEGRLADLNVSEQDGSSPAVRLTAIVKSAHMKKDGKPMVQVDLQLFESVEGEWVLRGEPSIGTYLDEKTTLTLDAGKLKRAAADYEVAVTVSAFDASKMPTSMDKATSQLDPLHILDRATACIGASAFSLAVLAASGDAQASGFQPMSCCHAGNLGCCNVI